MRSASSRDGALRKRERGNQCGRSRDGTLSFRAAGTKLMRVLRDGTLFVATSVDANAMQRNCSVNSQTFRGAGTSVARVCWTANRYSASSRDGALRKRDRGWGGRFCGLRGRFCACALPIPKEGPLGTISVRFNT